MNILKVGDLVTAPFVDDPHDCWYKVTKMKIKEVNINAEQYRVTATLKSGVEDWCILPFDFEGLRKLVTRRTCI